jgi:putative drug exporter of the RND superfamily
MRMQQILGSIGLFSARHRMVVVTAWLLVLGAFITVLTVASGGTPEERTVSTTETAATRAMDIVNEEFPSPAGSGSDDTLQLVIQTSGDTLMTDDAATADVAALLAQAGTIAGVTAVSDPFDPERPYVSESGTTAVATLSINGDLSDDEKQVAYDAVLDLRADAPDGVHVEVGGSLIDGARPGLGIGELAGVLVAIVVLFLTFGSLLAAGANMLVAFSGVAVGTVGVLAYGAIQPLQGTTLTLGVMLGLAVGIDYSLFILTRFRSELREGRTVEDAVKRSVSIAGTAVVFAGLTVIIALAGLSVVGISSITEMGLAGAFSVLIAVLMALTLLPVLLRTLGLRALPRKQRNQGVAGTSPLIVPEGSPSFLRRWGKFVVRRPIVALVGGALVLLVVASPMLSMRTVARVPGGEDPTSTERTAYNLIVDEFGGVQSPLVVLVQGDDVASQVTEIEATLGNLDGVQRVVPRAVNDAGDAALLTVIPVGSPIDSSTIDLVDEIRSGADSFPGLHIEVTGETAIGIDQGAALQQALIEYLILIVALSLVLLIIMFRSLLVPLVATLGFLLSVGASFGGSVAVFQWGWFDAIIPAPQGDPMMSMLPIILVGVLFGLAMDYQVFLVSKMKEMHDDGLAPRPAIFEGFSQSAPVLVAAAAIMTFVFAGFASSESAVAASIAFGLVVGVLADAFIVRLILMPAALSLLGKSAWWLPKWLDRLLPKSPSDAMPSTSNYDNSDLSPVNAGR